MLWVPRKFPSCKTETQYPVNTDSFCPRPQAWAATFPLPVSMNLNYFRYFTWVALYIICPSVTGLFHGAWCPSMGHSCCSVRQGFLLSSGPVGFSRVYRLHFLDPLLRWWPSGCCSVLAATSNASMNVDVQISLREPASSSLATCPEGGLPGGRVALL